MKSRDIRSGSWFVVESEEQFTLLKGYGKLEEDSFGPARVQKGTYDGPGNYYIVQYAQSCPRGCCFDSVNEVLNAEDAISEIREEIEENVDVLREAMTKR